MKGYWTCQRTTSGTKCRAVNSNRRHICKACGKKRPARKRPAHMSALDLPYEYYVELNDGPHCGICGKTPAPGKKFHRDHEHEGVGRPRGILCFPCNLQLKRTSTVAWLRAAAAYLERSDTQNVSLDVPVSGAGGVKSPANRSFGRGVAVTTPGRGTEPRRGPDA